METELTKTCSLKTSAPAIDVLFVGSRPTSAQLAQMLSRSGILWDTVLPEYLGEFLQHHSVNGVVVIDCELIDAVQQLAFKCILEDLDKKNVAAICYKCPDSIKTDHLGLVSKTQTIEFDELWARIETSLQFVKRFRNLCQARNTENGSACGDTASQLEIAGRVQRNFLPSQLPNTDFIRWACVYRPAEWVSGDIYDIARLDEEHIGFYLADAVGHSVPAALLTMFLKQAIVMRQTVADRYFIYKPADVIKTLNHRMIEQDLNGCLFATCVYGLLNIRTLQLDYARGGHPYPILIRDNKIISLQTRGGLLGVFETAEFEQHSLQLQTGDKLFIYSDGGEPLIGENKEDGTIQFSESFKDLCRMPIDEMLKVYSQMAAEYRFAPGQIDDVTAIGLEIK